MADVISTLFSSRASEKKSNKVGSIAIICAVVAIFTSCYSIHLSHANHEKSKRILMQEIRELKSSQNRLPERSQGNGSRLFRRSVFQGSKQNRPVSKSQSH